MNDVESLLQIPNKYVDDNSIYKNAGLEINITADLGLLS